MKIKLKTLTILIIVIRIFTLKRLGRKKDITTNKEKLKVVHFTYTNS